MSGSARQQFEKNLRLAVEVTTERVEDDVAAGLIADQLPQLVDRRKAHALVEAAYDAHHEEIPEIDRSTVPFARLEPDEFDELPEERGDLDSGNEAECAACDYGCDLCLPPHMLT